MSTADDDLPRPSVPAKGDGLTVRGHVAVPPEMQLRDSRLARVAQVVGIVRDTILIVLFVGLVVFGWRFLSAVSKAGQVPVAPGVSCATVTADEYGSFCAETPGG